MDGLLRLLPEGVVVLIPRFVSASSLTGGPDLR